MILILCLLLIIILLLLIIIIIIIIIRNVGNYDSGPAVTADRIRFNQTTFALMAPVNACNGNN